MSDYIVAFESTYGSTRQYAEDLATRLGVKALHLTEAAAAIEANSTAPVIVLSWYMALCIQVPSSSQIPILASGKLRSAQWA